MALRTLILLVMILFGGLRVATAQESATPESTLPAQAVSDPTAESDGLRGIFTEPGIFAVSQSVAGRDRSYLVAIPENYFVGDQPFALLLVLHGAGGTGENMVSLTDFYDLTTTEPFIAVFPDGLNGVWNDGRAGDPRIDSTVDDVSFLNGLIETMRDALNIDPARVYVTGYSMGGFMGMRLACRVPDKIAALATVAATLPQYLLEECGGAEPPPGLRPLPFLLVHGTNDVVVPWIGVITRSGSGYLSALDTVNHYAARNQCTGGGRIEDTDDVDADDGTRVLIETYENCTDDAEVGLIGVYRGGHTWPGHPFRGFSQLGLTSLDIDATRVIWAFFNRHTRSS
ncbi:MAG: alpha/beta fold hydrolase [bacterium]|nr:alpha/beta fold hydrolase [bacterium]